MSTSPTFIAIDAGTTGARASLVDLSGGVVLEARRPYLTATPHPGWAEQSADDWRDAALDALTDLISRIDSRSVEAIGLTGQCPSIAPIDSYGRPTGPGLIYRDNRAASEAQAMRERFGATALHARTGHVPEAFHVGPKVLWMRDHVPETYVAAERFMQPRDVVLLALTGVIATDETHANATALYDLRRRDWADDLLDGVALTRAIFPSVLPPWAKAGNISEEAARRTGAPSGLPVIIGAADSQCVAYGNGLFDPGSMSEMAGASSCLNSVVLEPLGDESITHYSHVIPNRYVTEVGLNTSGAAVRWAVDELAFSDYDSLEAAASRSYAKHRGSSGSDSLTDAPIFLPYLADGERDDPGLRAAFLGLSDRHGRDDLAYAVLEGVAFGVVETVATLIAAGSPCKELRVSGGAARIALLGRLKADVLGVPVAHLTVDTAPVGAALLAAGTVGYADAARAAIAAGLARAIRFEPEDDARGALMERFGWFRSVREAAAVRVANSSSKDPTDG